MDIYITLTVSKTSLVIRQSRMTGFSSEEGGEDFSRTKRNFSIAANPNSCFPPLGETGAS